ncbi:C-glycoside deglycosidase beta subunit domain-containing protein [Konateibacter massiliensis]|uniref:C-glycoside deglycosidase beta subunit domain-containing protein n=1 Tax=Konateibacter massiliensis TaxID=2002841 RepID=UPI000C157BD2|nr:DUF6379 domain-containing protein [Konateibacter massiliensis]
MFDNYVFTEGTCKNVKEGNQIVGFELETLITYYRSIPCSMIEDIKVSVDNQEVPREVIRFSPDGEEYFTLDELETVTSYKWEYGEQGHVRVMQEDGLSAGDHEVSLTTIIRTAYIPVPFGGTKVRTVHI